MRPLPIAPGTLTPQTDATTGTQDVAGVSVVLCTRNGLSRGFLHEALHSVLRQTCPAAEVLVVDDGSVDGTADFVRQGFPSVKVLANAGRGLAAARNTGIAAARGHWIALLDDDDVWYPEKLSRQLAQAQASGEADSTLWLARMRIFCHEAHAPHDAEADAEMEASREHLASWPACLIYCPVTPSGVMFARSLWLRHGPMDESISVGAAYEFWVRCFSMGVRARFSDEVLSRYRRHAGQMTRWGLCTDTMRAMDQFLLPYLGKLPPRLQRRMHTARFLVCARSALVRGGVARMRHYVEATPLQPAFGVVAVWLFWLLDSAASALPTRWRSATRRWAYAVLLPEGAVVPLAHAKDVAT